MSTDEGTDPMLLRQRLDGAVITTYVLLMLALPLRFFCRRAGKSGFGWDDYLACLSCVFANALFYVIMIPIRPYLGFHALEVGMEGVAVFVKSFLAAQLFYLVSIGITKLSILAFYWRLFAVAGRIPIIAMTVVVVLWVVILVCLILFQCKPINATWDIAVVNKTCLDTKAIYKGGSIPNVLTDLILMIMPLPHIWRLQIRLAQRLVLGGVFIVGCFVLIVSIIRLKIVLDQDVNDPDVTYNMVEVVIWSVVEVNVGLLCACLPSLRPVFTFLRLGRFFNTSREGQNTPQGVGSALSGQSKNRSRRKGSSGGLFSSIADLTKSGDDEDGFVMIDNESKSTRKGKNGDMWGKNRSNVEATHISDDEPNPSHRQSLDNSHGITVRNEWTVQVDDKAHVGQF